MRPMVCFMGSEDPVLMASALRNVGDVTIFNFYFKPRAEVQAFVIAYRLGYSQFSHGAKK